MTDHSSPRYLRRHLLRIMFQLPLNKFDCLFGVQAGRRVKEAGHETFSFPEHEELLSGRCIGHVDTEEMRVHSQAGFRLTAGYRS